jgi:dolichol-phosphate mannosyltransferase
VRASTDFFYEIPEYEKIEIQKKLHNAALIIPILNEGSRIIDQLKKIQNEHPRVDVIIADGGSTDGAIDEIIAKQLDVSAILINKNAGGLSTQIRMAFHYCMDNEYLSVITMDGNNKDGVDGISEILHLLEKGFDFVQGSRFAEGGRHVGTPFGRLLGLKLIHSPLISLIAKFRYTDTTNGFRGHSIEMLRNERLRIFNSNFTGYRILPYISVQASLLGYRCCEIGVTREYPKSGPVPTKIKGLKGNFRILGDLARVVTKKDFPKKVKSL